MYYKDTFCRWIVFNQNFTDPNNKLLIDRLARVSQQIRGIQLFTIEEYQAEVYSAVNAVLSLGVAMTPLNPVGAEGPAIVGDVSDNFTILNNDAADIAAEVLRVEDSAADSYNLAATTLNQLRQQIRESLYQSNKQRYSEDFINSQNLTNVSANIDFNAGVSTNPIISTTTLVPTITIGPGSIGIESVDNTLPNLTSNIIGQFFEWDGTVLELVLSFATAQIMNRVTINLDDYSGLEIDTFTTTPDGTLVQDVLADLGTDRIEIDGTSNKFSGDVIIDFPPRYTLTARIIIRDRTKTGVSLRNLTCEQISYSSTGQVTSIPINNPTGFVKFNTIQNIFAPYVTITHQISYNGTQFTAITPDSTIQLTSNPFFYRAVLQRSAAAFSAQSPLNQSPLDPVGSPYYTLTTSTSTPLGNGIIERTLQVDDIIGPIILRESPSPNTLIIQVGSVILSPANGDYIFNNNTITLSQNLTGVTITYQTSSLGSAAVSDLESYYTPLLYEFKFEA